MNALGIYSQDGDRLTTMDFRWNVPQVRHPTSTVDGAVREITARCGTYNRQFSNIQCS